MKLFFPFPKWWCNFEERPLKAHCGLRKGMALRKVHNVAEKGHDGSTCCNALDVLFRITKIYN